MDVMWRQVENPNASRQPVFSHLSKSAPGFPLPSSMDGSPMFMVATRIWMMESLPVPKWKPREHTGLVDPG